MKLARENVFFDFCSFPCNQGLGLLLSVHHSNSVTFVPSSALILPSMPHFKGLVMMILGLSGKIWANLPIPINLIASVKPMEGTIYRFQGQSVWKGIVIDKLIINIAPK